MKCFNLKSESSVWGDKTRQQEKVPFESIYVYNISFLSYFSITFMTRKECTEE